MNIPEVAMQNMHPEAKEKLFQKLETILLPYSSDVFCLMSATVENSNSHQHIKKSVFKG